MHLPASRTRAGAAGLAALIAEPWRAVVALDFDGTLAPIVPRPADARPAAGAIDALARISGVVGATAIVTGRPAMTAVDIAGLRDHPGLDRLVVLGHYGLERWAAATGELTRPALPEGVAEVRAALPGLLADPGVAGDIPGIEVEDKDASLAVHVRNTPDPDAALAALREPLADLAERTGLVLEPGRMVLELRPPGIDKGAALVSFVTEREAHAVLYAGDDLGDLAAYDAVARLRDQGVAGVTVCASSPEVAPLRERADIVVEGPVGVVALLDQLVGAIGTGG